MPDNCMPDNCPGDRGDNETMLGAKVALGDVVMCFVLSNASAGARSSPVS